MAAAASWGQQVQRERPDVLLKAAGVVAAAVGVVALLFLARDDARSFDSLPQMYEPLASVGLDCSPPPPVQVDAETRRARAFCSASDGSLAVLELSGSYADAEQAVADAHAGSRDVVRYARLAKQMPVPPRPVLLGGNWTLTGDLVVLEQVAAEYGGTIYPYPEVP